jgi:hypothetical protein
VQLLLPLANSDTNCDSHGEGVVRRIPYLILRGHASLFPISGKALAPLSNPTASMTANCSHAISKDDKLTKLSRHTVSQRVTNRSPLSAKLDAAYVGGSQPSCDFTAGRQRNLEASKEWAASKFKDQPT